jgi:hypothetical protein
VGSGNTATCLKNREWRCGVDVRGSGWTSFLRTRKVLMVRAYVSLVSLVRECVRSLCFVELDFRRNVPVQMRPCADIRLSATYELTDALWDTEVCF